MQFYSTMKSPTFYLERLGQLPQLHNNELNSAAEFFGNDAGGGGGASSTWGTSLFAGSTGHLSNSTPTLNEAARAPWSAHAARNLHGVAADNNNRNTSDQQQIMRQMEINKEHFINNNTNSSNNNGTRINYETRNSSSTSLSQVPSSSFSMCASSSSTVSQQQQQNNQQQKNPKLYKTELCRSWADTGRCNYGERCQYAHGENEKRPIPRHPKYKTEACQSYHKTGYCPYGPRCHFIHNEEPHVIASLIAANNAAASNGVSASSTPVTPDTVNCGFHHQNGLRQIHSLGGGMAGDSGGVGCSTPTTPHRATQMFARANFADASSQMVQRGVPNVSMSNYAPRPSGQSAGGQHQPLMVTQSVGGNNMNYGRNYNPHQALYQHATNEVAQSPQLQSTAAFSNNDEQVRTASARGATGMRLYHEEIPLPLHTSSQQLPPLTAQCYKSTPLSSQPQKRSKFFFGQPHANDYFTPLTGNTPANSTPTHALSGTRMTGIGNTTPPGSTTSADSGTESPELGLSSGSGSSATSGGFSPPGLDTPLSNANRDDTEHLLRLSPESFRHKSLLIMGGLGDVISSASYASAVHRQFKDNESRTSDDNTIMGEEYLSSPLNYDVSSNLLGGVSEIDFYSEFHTLSLGSSATPIASDFAAKAKNSSIGILGSTPVAPAVSSAVPPSPGDEFFSNDNSVHWSNIDLTNQATQKLFNEAAEYPRRSSGSSLGSAGIANGADSVETPTSTSSSAASIAEEMWTTLTAASTTTTTATAVGRLPIFEQLSNGPLA